MEKQILQMYVNKHSLLQQDEVEDEMYIGVMILFKVDRKQHVCETKEYVHLNCTVEQEMIKQFFIKQQRELEVQIGTKQCSLVEKQ